MEVIPPTAVSLELGRSQDLPTDRVAEEPIETITDLLLSKVRESPDSIFVSYPATAKGKCDYVDYSVSQIDAFADEAARKYALQGLFPQHPTSSEAEVVAILAPSNLNYVVSILALSRIGFAILFLSNRLSREAYVNLLKKTNCRKLIVSSNQTKTAEEIKSEYPLSVFNLPELVDYQSTEAGSPRFPVSKGPNASKRVSFIIHSSGSTGLPKPIFQTHAACLSNYSSGIPYRAFLTLPLFHNHGISTLFRALVAGKKIAMYNANLPLAGSSLTEAMEAVQPESLHCVPYALKLMAETDKGINMLKRCKLVLFGGSSCPDDLGDKLVAAGVYIVGHYGATEMGQLMTSFRDPGDKYWNYMRPLESAKPFLRMLPAGNDTFELVVLDGLPSKVLSNSDDPPNSYYTKDTFVPHPTIPDAWKYLGRLDDRITLVNGEKVLPVPYEHSIRQSELLHEAIVFGVGRAVPGLLVIPSERAKDIPKQELLDQLMPAIELANSKCEAFGRISREMVEVLDSDIQYPRTDKGTVIRAAFYRQFDQLINEIYARFESPPEPTDESKLATLTEDDLVSYLLELFRAKTGAQELEPGTDFFDAGIDSLQAITIRAQVCRDMNLNIQALGQNVVFEYPSVELLAKHLYSLRSGEKAEKDDEIALMRQLIDKYSSFSPREPGSVSPDGETVILTGTTGSLGAHILGQLVKKTHVKKVWCLVRAASPLAAHVRVLSTLAAKGISDLSAQELGKIISLPADLSSPSLGLSEFDAAQLRDTLTTVIHSAWAVNFNLGVRSFESHHIRGTHNLLNFCLSTRTVEPARLFFCSSISAAAGTPIPATVREMHIENLAHAQKMGYARSKLVTEHIIRSAAQKTGMKARVFRIGQIMGDTENGMWNATEAIPLMLQSARTLGALPALDETPSWMPVDLVAKACIELAGLSGAPPSGASTLDNDPATSLDDLGTVYQVQNNRLFHWTNELLPALQASGLAFRVVPQREWVQLLRDSDPDPVKNPTFKLLDFFAEKYDNDKPGRMGLEFDTVKTGEQSETIRNGFDVVESGLLAKMVAWWGTQW
ncbi:acetyl-CoA synthetase-like protein [Thozetella sp. PMI_491]|nr:acetyl-CoA synthetase-like protein [Thozetella sp. PMI_491]